ncbi:MAG: hypothetical protein JXA13_08275 [Anaerolineales bacterium]|nr:hypothetical protein [Anaerolineales bacterium]
MAEYKRATRYRAAYFPSGPEAGTTKIVVLLEDGSKQTYEKLPPDTAHHLIDLLRNEEPVWVDQDTGMLAVSDEPVGSGEQ